jgi:hypothetical protein
LYGAINYESRQYSVKITVKVYQREGNKAYSYEVRQIESPEGTLGNLHFDTNKNFPRTTGLAENKSHNKGTNNFETGKEK